MPEFGFYLIIQFHSSCRELEKLLMLNAATLHLLTHLLDDGLTSSDVVSDLITHVEKAYLINFHLILQTRLKGLDPLSRLAFCATRHLPNPCALEKAKRDTLPLLCIRRRSRDVAPTRNDFQSAPDAQDWASLAR